MLLINLKIQHFRIAFYQFYMAAETSETNTLKQKKDVASKSYERFCSSNIFRKFLLFTFSLPVSPLLEKTSQITCTKPLLT